MHQYLLLDQVQNKSIDDMLDQNIGSQKTTMIMTRSFLQSHERIINMIECMQSTTLSRSLASTKDLCILSVNVPKQLGIC